MIVVNDIPIRRAALKSLAHDLSKWSKGFQDSIEIKHKKWIGAFCNWHKELTTLYTLHPLTLIFCGSYNGSYIDLIGHFRTNNTGMKLS